MLFVVFLVVINITAKQLEDAFNAYKEDTTKRIGELNAAVEASTKKIDDLTDAQGPLIVEGPGSV